MRSSTNRSRAGHGSMPKRRPRPAHTPPRWTRPTPGCAPRWRVRERSRSQLVLEARRYHQRSRRFTAPLAIEDYAWSGDGARLLIFTNTRKVWRDNTRGDYWVLDHADDYSWSIVGEGSGRYLWLLSR